MSFIISTRAELIKTRRSSSFWLSLIGGGVIPFVFFLMYAMKPDRFYSRLETDPWGSHFFNGWQSFAAFLLPMFVILICSLIPQIEYKNNTWKQVFASPQPVGDVFFSKYCAIIIMVLFLFLSFNVLMILAGLCANLLHSKYTFTSSSIDWVTLIKLNVRSLVSLLGIISIQYWLSLRFRNFIVPIGIGLGLLVTSMILNPWEHIDKVPYSYPFLTLIKTANSKGLSGLQSHEWNSVIYFILFSGIAFADMRFRRERG